MICCCEAAKQMERVDKRVAGYMEVAEVFVDMPREEYLNATIDYRAGMVKVACKEVLDGVMDSEVLLCFARKLMEANEEVWQRFHSENDSDAAQDDVPHELNSVLHDMEDEFEQFAEDFDRHLKAVAQAFELHLKGSFTRDGANEVYRRAYKRIDDAYKSGLIDDSIQAEYIADLLAAIKEVSE